MLPGAEDPRRDPPTAGIGDEYEIGWGRGKLKCVSPHSTVVMVAIIYNFAHRLSQTQRNKTLCQSITY